MTRAEIDTAVRRHLGAVAPEADLGALDPSATLTDALDIDSMDFLNFIIALHRDLGVDIPEKDYGELRSLEGAGRYLATRLGVA